MMSLWTTSGERWQLVSVEENGCIVPNAGASPDSFALQREGQGLQRRNAAHSGQSLTQAQYPSAPDALDMAHPATAQSQRPTLANGHG